MQSKISDKLKRWNLRGNSSPDLLKSPARKLLGNLKLVNEGKPKGFTKCLLYQLFQETNSQMIFPVILKGKKLHESRTNEGRDTQMATRVSKSARVTTTCFVNTSCKKDKMWEC